MKTDLMIQLIFFVADFCFIHFLLKHLFKYFFFFILFASKYSPKFSLFSVELISIQRFDLKIFRIGQSQSEFVEKTCQISKAFKSKLIQPKIKLNIIL